MQFASKKNRVFLVVVNNMPVVVKIFRSKRSALKEWQMLYRLKALSLPAPQPIMMFKNWIVRQFIDGVSITELLEEGNVEWVERLADWLHKFHKFTEMRLVDLSLENFLFDNGEVYCIDFDDVQKRGTPLADVGELVANLVRAPVNSIQTRLFAARKFLKIYSKVSDTPLEKFRNYIRRSVLSKSVGKADKMTTKELESYVPQILE